MASAYHCKIMKFTPGYTHLIININCIAYRDYERDLNTAPHRISLYNLPLVCTMFQCIV